MEEIRVLNVGFELIAIVDDYISLVWTDRYAACGDFVLTLKTTSPSLKFLQTDYYLRIDQSDYIMIVETRSIDADTDVMTITGRSLESTFERRTSTQAAVAASGAMFTGSAYTYLYNLVNEALNIPNPPGTWKNANDYLPYFANGPALVGSPTLQRSYYNGQIYDELVTVAALTGLGFRYKLYDNPVQGLLAMPRLQYDLYMGTDRSADQSTVPWVVFSPEIDNLVKVSTVESTAGYYNYAYVLAVQPGAVTTPVLKRYNAPNVVTNIAGMDRRDILVDGSSVDITKYTAPVYQSKLLELAYNALQAHKLVHVIDGTIVEGEYIYDRDYYLGDIVNLGIDPATQQKVRITEHILSVDANGISSYPTLTVYEEAWFSVWNGTPNPGV